MSDRDCSDQHDAMPRVDIDLLWRSITAPATAQEPAPSASPMSEETPVTCPTCRGAGWYTLAVRVGDPRFGVLQMCDCRRQAIQQQATSRRDARRLARLDALQADLRDDIGSMATATFATFRLDRPLAASVTWCGLTANRADQARNLADALAAMHAYANQPVGWRMLIGPTGSGKSHLAGAVWSALRTCGVPILAATTEGLLRCLRQGIADHTTDERLETMQQVDMLILDDFGVEHRTPWALEKLYALIHARTEANRPTLITGNLPLESLRPLTSSDPITDELAMRWERLVSRISGMCGEEIILLASDLRRRHRYAVQADA